MSSATSAGTNSVEQVLEPEPYVEAFPALGHPSHAGDTRMNGVAPPPRAVKVKSSSITQVFYVPLEERRYKHDQPFGNDATRQAAVIQEITKAHEVQVETNLAKDQSLTVVITGKPDAVLRARRDISNKLQTQAQVTMNIPKEHHRFLLGKSGKKLAELELDTATKITVPRQEENSDIIRVTGTKEGIEKAMHEIQLISDEQAKLAFERLEIPKIYHPFIVGANNSLLKSLQESTGARINVPPPSVMKDELTVAGEKDGVLRAVQEIRKIYNDKKQRCQTVSVEVKKQQHKYVIGPRGQGLQDVLAQLNVSVEVPPLDSPSQTITLRGEPDKLGPALSIVYQKANSVVCFNVDCPSWLHRFIIGKQGSVIKKVMSEVPKVHIEFADGEDKISLEGPPEEVTIAQKELEKMVAELRRTMDHAELPVNKKYHRNIIGKNGQNRQRLMQETNTNIRIPAEEDPSDIIRIEGDPAGVKKVKAELMEMVKKMDNEKTRDILMEQRFHKQLIGQKGEAIKEIRDMFNQVQISLPDAGKKSDIITLRGPKDDVDRVYKYLEKMHKDLILSNHVAEVRIFKDFHKNIIGKGGATIKKIRDETNTKIDLPNQLSDSDVIKITGKKEDVEKARIKIEQIQKELANIAEETLIIDHKLHNSVIGTKGRYIRAIMQECGGVIIRFPAENANSDKVVIRGPKADVENAKKQLLDLVEDRKINSYTSELQCKPDFHRFLIGRGGVNIQKVREKFGARVVFPSDDDDHPDMIHLIGKKEHVEAARLELVKQIKELENIVEDTVTVPVKWHKSFVARRGEMLNQIAADYGGVSVSFPRSGSTSEIVTLSGPKDCVSGAKNRILEIVKDLEAMITITCVIPQKYHRQVMGAKGMNVQEVTKQFNVQIKFPERPKQDRPKSQDRTEQESQDQPDVPTAETSNGHTEEEEEEEEVPVNPDATAVPDSPVSPSPAIEEAGDSAVQDTIYITGKAELAEEARLALLALVPITTEMDIPYEFHRFIIGQKGKDIRQMMEEYNVNISIPPSNLESSVVKILGVEANVQKAIQGLNAKLVELEKDKADKEARSFQLELRVDPKYHPKIIGRKGAVISKIRKDHEDVNIQFPEREGQDSDRILITGYEASAHAAREDILKIVHDLESLTTLQEKIDHRVHNRIIGARGAQIRRIMEQFQVEVKFPKGEDKDLVEITGAEENCLDCIDELKNIEEEYLQDVIEREETQRYMKPSRQDTKSEKNTPSTGFVVRGAPWDTNSSEDFPTIGPASSAAVSNGGSRFGAWGKK